MPRTSTRSSASDRSTAGPADRSDDQTKQAQLWAGVISSTGLNAIWNNVARDTARSKGLDLVDAARVFALLDVSMNDSILTSHSSKFVYGLWRPVTAIRRAAEDLNDLTEADPTWSSLLGTPPYPAYGGNMACVGAGAATALALAFGTDDVPITVVWKGNRHTDRIRTSRKTSPDSGRSPWTRPTAASTAASTTGSTTTRVRFVCPKVSHFVFDNYMQPKDTRPRRSIPHPQDGSGARTAPEPSFPANPHGSRVQSLHPFARQAIPFLRLFEACS